MTKQWRTRKRGTKRQRGKPFPTNSSQTMKSSLRRISVKTRNLPKLHYPLWVDSIYSKKQERREGTERGAPEIRVIQTDFGRVYIYVGSETKQLAPQITDIEVDKKFRGMGFGEKLFFIAITYLATNPNPSIRKTFRKGGIGTTWDMTTGFWKHLAEKYGGRKVKTNSTHNGYSDLGDWHFKSIHLPKFRFEHLDMMHIKRVEDAIGKGSQ